MIEWTLLINMHWYLWDFSSRSSGDIWPLQRSIIRAKRGSPRSFPKRCSDRHELLVSSGFKEDSHFCLESFVSFCGLYRASNNGLYEP
jgi:hypothetical protein